jgi:F-type H+-transporting ATPase subunit b
MGERIMQRGWIVLFVVCAALTALAAGRVVAQEHGKAEGPAAAGHGDAKGHEEGKENVFQGFLDLTIWTIVVFLLLAFLLRKYAWGPMLEGLQRREDAIHGALQEAQKVREEAERVRGQLQHEMNHAHEKVRDLLDTARRDATRTTEEMVTKARGEIQGERERLRREIETARDQALQQLWNQTAHLATDISAKVMRRELSSDDQRRLIDQALAELQKENVGWKEHSLAM